MTKIFVHHRCHCLWRGLLLYCGEKFNLWGPSYKPWLGTSATWIPNYPNSRLPRESACKDGKRRSPGTAAPRIKVVPPINQVVANRCRPDPFMQAPRSRGKKQLLRQFLHTWLPGSLKVRETMRSPYGCFRLDHGQESMFGLGFGLEYCFGGMYRAGQTGAPS